MSEFFSPAQIPFDLAHSQDIQAQNKKFQNSPIST